jgi:peptide/nickel transport system substrate-binding protein
MKGTLTAGLLGALVLTLSGCSSGDDHGKSAGSPLNDPLRGGTLRVGVDHPFGTEPPAGAEHYVLDPQFEYLASYLELYRCCLLRTLFSYSGQPSSHGGAVLHPDLAVSKPQVSDDGLDWTFHLKRGLHYAPPFQRREIASGDIIRAVQREVSFGDNGGFPSYYTVIEGANAFAAHKADSISGLEAPDAHTLVVHLTEPTGDLDYRFSIPVTAPIPPGAARGHELGYGRYLVSSGPYMIAGSEKMNFALPPDQQKPASGLVYRYALRGEKVVILGRESLTLVRNPSWDAASDRLRKAYPDRIELEMRGGPNSEQRRNAGKVDRGALDVILDDSARFEQARRYERSPVLRKRLHVNPEAGVEFITMNLAVRPFDDVHVRRALNFALNREALTKIENRASVFGPVTPTAHLFPDSVEGDLLATYDPYPLGGDIAAARTEMARSRYDRDHDGRCDSPLCRNVVAYGIPHQIWALRGADASIRRDFALVGVFLSIKHASLKAQFGTLGRPSTHAPMSTNSGWLVDFPDGAGFEPVLKSPREAGNNDFSLLGATSRQLDRWGYQARSVPSVNAKIAECRSLLGGPRTRCWAELDQLLTERIVPWVPRAQYEFAEATSARVAHYSFDVFAPGPALDRIALKRSSH